MSHQGPRILCWPVEEHERDQFVVFIGNLKIYSNQGLWLNRTASMDNAQEGGKHDEGGTGRSWRLGTSDPPPAEDRSYSS